VHDKPLLISPPDRLIEMSHVDQPIVSLVDGTSAGPTDDSPFSASYISMRPGAVDPPRCHANTWVYVLLWSASVLGAITMYGRTFEGMIHQKPGQLLVVPPEIPYATANPSPTNTVVAYKFYAGPSSQTDDGAHEDLRSHLDRQLPMLFDIPANQSHR
jgi:uncharacterized RmlC-like cupin family protein